MKLIKENFNEDLIRRFKTIMNHSKRYEFDDDDKLILTDYNTGDSVKIDLIALLQYPEVLNEILSEYDDMDEAIITRKGMNKIKGRQ